MGDTTPEKARIEILARLALLPADCAEWIMWAVSWGARKPALLNRQRVEDSVFEQTFCIDKTKERLRYQPVMNMEEGVRKGVKRALERERAREAGRNVAAT
jgi:sterol-4alpha-carboxylate 3-dehydrogenase (decarboxylating)